MNPYTIAVVGGECSGKTTLSRALAEALNCPWYGEYAREWVDVNQRDVAHADVMAIYLGEKARMEEGLRRNSAFVVFDTTLIQTKVYSDFYFGRSPAELVRDARRERLDLYLVTDPDIPWVPEARQRGEQLSRGRVHSAVVAELEARSACFVVLTGSPDERLSSALAAARTSMARRL